MSFSLQQIQRFFEALDKAENVLLGTHLNPDGDALGSALAVAHYLKEIGVDHEVLCHHPAPYNLQFLPGAEKIRQTPRRKDFDVGIVVDLSSMDRLGHIQKYFNHCQTLIIVDHHLTEDPPGDICLIDSKAPATALILAKLFKSYQKNFIFTKEFSTCLLTGIVTDTGGFKWSNTTAESLELSAELMQTGGDLFQINQEVYHNRPLSSVRLLGKTLQIMKTSGSQNLAWASLSQNIFYETGSSEEHTDGLVNELLGIEKIQIAAILRESEDELIRVSLRSKGNYDVAAIASQFGGGGHKNAAGCTFRIALQEAEKILIQTLEKCLES